jgi:hypothetical protein
MQKMSTIPGEFEDKMQKMSINQGEFEDKKAENEHKPLHSRGIWGYNAEDDHL